MSKIIVTVQGGAVVDVSTPEGVEVEVRDYDVYGEHPDELEEDDKGWSYTSCIWGAGKG